MQRRMVTHALTHCSDAGIPPDQQRLSMSLKELDDRRTLASYHVTSDTTIILNLRLFGGVPPDQVPDLIPRDNESPLHGSAGASADHPSVSVNVQPPSRPISGRESWLYGVWTDDDGEPVDELRDPGMWAEFVAALSSGRVNRASVREFVRSCRPREPDERELNDMTGRDPSVRQRTQTASAARPARHDGSGALFSPHFCVSCMSHASRLCCRCCVGVYIFLFYCNSSCS